MRLLRQIFGTLLSNTTKQLGHVPSDVKKSWPRYCSTKPINLKDFIKKVEPFGKITIDVPYDVEIRTIDPHKYSDGSTLIVNVISNEVIPENKLNDDIITVDIKPNACEIKAVDNEDTPLGIKCLVQAPPRYDVEVRTSREGNVDVSGMISEYVNIQTEYGNIRGSKLQGKKITLSSSEGGSVTLKNSVQGNIEINTAQDGLVDAEKCLGTKLDISTENGNVILGSNYCELATFTTENGHMMLNNLHMDSTIDINGIGSLNISCLDGSIQARLGEGDANIQLVRITGDSYLKTNGNVSLKVPEDSDAQLILTAQQLDVDNNIRGQISENKTEFTVQNKGSKFKVETDKKVQLKQASWMDCLDLKKVSV